MHPHKQLPCPSATHTPTATRFLPRLTSLNLSPPPILCTSTFSPWITSCALRVPGALRCCTPDLSACTPSRPRTPVAAGRHTTQQALTRWAGRLAAGDGAPRCFTQPWPGAGCQQWWSTHAGSGRWCKHRPCACWANFKCILSPTTASQSGTRGLDHPFSHAELLKAPSTPVSQHLPQDEHTGCRLCCSLGLGAKQAPSMAELAMYLLPSPHLSPWGRHEQCQTWAEPTSYPTAVPTPEPAANNYCCSLLRVHCVPARSTPTAALAHSTGRIVIFQIPKRECCT